MTPYYSEAITDILGGIRSTQMWGRIGWAETRRRYRRTVFGPFWSSISLAIFVVAMGIVWANIWNMDPKKYLAFLNSGMLAWVLLSSFLNEGCQVFVASETLIKQFPINYMMLVCSLMWRNLLVFFHNFIVYVPVYIYSGLPVTMNTLLVVPGIILLCINGLWISLSLGMLCARYRDVQQVIVSFLQISMFVTPIFWSPEQLTGKAALLVHYNLLYHYVAIIREPLMGTAPSAWTWSFVLVATVVGWAGTIFIFARFRRRLAYWL